jgi:hypothetical protein
MRALSTILCDQMRLLHFAHPHVDVEILADQVSAPVQQLQPYLQIRMTLAQHREDRRHMFAAEPQARADPQQSMQLRAAIGECVGHGLYIVEDFLRPLQSRFTIGRHADPARGPLQQLHAETGLQRGNALAHMRRRQTHFRRCRDKAAPPRDVAKQLEIAQERLIIGCERILIFHLVALCRCRSTLP